jgi:nanoRNase/pAp phosphatase (c-di-AMP/oligoRNAs hydrolase)
MKEKIAKKCKKAKKAQSSKKQPCYIGYNPPASLLSALEDMKGKEVIVTSHSLADADAVASAFALSEWIGPCAVHALADRANSQAKRLFAGELKAAISFKQARMSYPNAPIILVDCNDRQLLPHIEGQKVDILIDHHALSYDSARARIEWVEPGASSCSELVASIIKFPTPQIAQALALGILSDSAQLMRADSRSLRALACMLEHSSLSFEQLLEILRHPPKLENRAAVLEGLRQSTWRIENGWLIASAAVSSNESHVADALINAGADAVFVGTSDEKGARISARLRPRLASSLNLPEIMLEVGRFLGGSGGGHPAAAGARGPKSNLLEDALILAQKLLVKKM